MKHRISSTNGVHRYHKRKPLLIDRPYFRTTGLALFGILFAAIGTMFLPSSRAQSVYAPPASIANDCSSEVTQPILDWLATVPDGSAIQFGVNKCYNIEGPIRIVNRHNLTIDGRGSEFRAVTDGSTYPSFDGKPSWPRHRAHWVITKDSSNIVLKNTIVRGPNTANVYSPTLEAQHAYAVSDRASNITLQDIKGYDVHGDGVTVAGEASGVIIRNAYFSGTGRQGIAVTSGSNILFDSFTLTRVARSAIDLEPIQQESVNGVTFQNGTFQAPINFYIFANGGTGLGISNVTLKDNRVLGKNWSALSQVNNGSIRKNYTFINNTSDTSTNHPPSYTFDNIQNFSVTGAYQSYSGKLDVNDPAIKVAGTSCGTQSNNQFPGITIVMTPGAPACTSDPSPPPPPGEGTAPGGNTSGSSGGGASQNQSGSTPSTTSGSDTNVSTPSTSNASGGSSIVGGSQPVVIRGAGDVPKAIVQAVLSPTVGKKALGKNYPVFMIGVLSLICTLIALAVYELHHSKRAHEILSNAQHTLAHAFNPHQPAFPGAMGNSPGPNLHNINHVPGAVIHPEEDTHISDNKH